MLKELVAKFPRCSEKLTATRLSRNNCELELNGDFPQSKFHNLSTAEIDFVIALLMMKEACEEKDLRSLGLRFS